jgi:hypothetical protein
MNKLPLLVPAPFFRASEYQKILLPEAPLDRWEHTSSHET